MQALCGRFAGLALTGSKERCRALPLASKSNGIAASQKIISPRAHDRRQDVSCTLGLDVQCADGRRGGKLKTRKAAAKRFQVTGSGRVLVRHAGKNHFQEKKSGKRKQKLSLKHLASKAHKDNITGCLPYAKIK